MGVIVEVHVHSIHRTGLSKNRRDDETGLSIPPAASEHIVALVTRQGGQRDSNYFKLMKP